MTYKEAYNKVFVAVSEAEAEYLGLTLSEDDRKRIDDWDKAIDIVEKAAKIAEALKALVEQMEANGDIAVRIGRLKSLLEYGK